LLARRYRELDDEIAGSNAMIKSPVNVLGPELFKRHAVVEASTTQWLLTADDNPERLHSEASFAARCGTGNKPLSKLIAG